VKSIALKGEGGADPGQTKAESSSLSLLLILRVSDCDRLCFCYSTQSSLLATSY
jgi:hypothetical protein